MSRKKKVLSAEEIDELVTRQANDETAWDKPVRVRQAKAPQHKIPRRVESQRINPTSQKE
jgi:hypothetical protein